jgi:hypothetical protein
MFNVTEGAIAQRVAKLEKPAAASNGIVVKQAHASVWNVKEALTENFAGCLKLLDDKDVDKVRIRAEIRQHIKLSMDVIQTLYAVNEVQAFQEEVLAILDECEPGTRERILTRLQQKRAVRAAFTGSLL